MSLHGLDLDAAALNEAHLHVPTAFLTARRRAFTPLFKSILRYHLLSFPFAVGE